MRESAYRRARTMPLIRVLRVITRLNVGGPAQHAVFLTSGLNGSHFESKLVTGKTDHHEGDMNFLAEKHGVQLIQLDSLSNGSGPLADIRAFWHLYQIIKKESPDLVHLQLLKARFFGGVAAKLARVPVIVETFHGNLFSEYYGNFKTAAILAAERFLGWLIVDRVIAVSEGQREELIRYKICPERKITVIPLGLDLKRFVQCSTLRGQLRQELGVSEETILIGSVGRLVPIKGLFYLLDTVAKLKFSTKTDFQLLIAGDGVLRKELEQKATCLGLQDRVRFLGWRFDLEKIYADLDIVVLSSFNEGTPVSVIEAMAAGKAVVATRVGGVPDVVDDGVSGILVPPKDSDTLARSLARLVEDADLRATLGQHAKESVYPKYDVSRLIEDMKNFYLRVLESRQSSIPSHTTQ